MAVHRLFPLIIASLLDHSQVEVAGHISRDDAQAFTDAVNKSYIISPSKDGLNDSN